MQVFRRPPMPDWAGRLFHAHVTGFDETLMPRQRFVQQVRRVQAAAGFFGTVEVVAQLVTVVGVGAVFNDKAGALTRGFAAQIGQTLLGDQHHHVVLGVVVVGNHRHDAGNRPAFGYRRRHEEGQEGVAGEVAGAANAVHHFGAHDVGGIDVAVDVGFDHRVHADDAEAADQLGVVGHFLRTQDDFAAQRVDVVVEALECVGAERQGGGGCGKHFAAQNQVEHAVLQYFGVADQIVKRAVLQAGQYGVGNVADTRLQRQQVFRQASHFDFVREEVDDFRSDALGHFVRLGEFAVAVGRVGQHDADDFVQVASHIGRADALAGFGQHKRLAVGRQAEAVVDVGHAFEFSVLLGVDFNDDFFCVLQPGNVGADCQRGNQFAVGGNACHFDDGYIHIAEETGANLRLDVRQVHIHVIGVARVNLVAHGGVGLEGAAERNGIGAGEHAVAFVGSGRAGNHANGVGLARLVGGLCLFGDGGGNGFGVARAGKAADADGHAVFDKGGGLFGGNDFLAQAFVLHTFCCLGHEVFSFKYILRNRP